jgi:hypothetical protein
MNELVVFCVVRYCVFIAFLMTLQFIKNERDQLILTKNGHIFYRNQGSIEATHGKCQFAGKRKGLYKARVTKFTCQVLPFFLSRSCLETKYGT